MAKSKKQEEPTYSNLVVEIHADNDKYEGVTHPALTEEDVDEFLGWEDEPLGADGESTWDEFDLRDMNQRKVRLNNNVGNRPLNRSHAMDMAQDILNDKWVLNGETMVIGDKGHILSAQHRAIALKFACQMWADPDNNDKYKKGRWKDKPPTMDSIVVKGVKEDTETRASQDQGLPRTVADALYMSPLYKEEKNPQRRHSLCKEVDMAVRILWARTGHSSSDAMSPRRTHAEAVEYTLDHKKAPAFVKTLYDVNSNHESALSRRGLRPGTCAGLMYLMAAQDTDFTNYSKKGRKESQVDFEHADEAYDFWNGFATGSEKLSALRDAIVRLNDASLTHSEESGGHAGGTSAEKIAVVVKAWKAFVNKGEVTDEDVQLQYKRINGMNKLAEAPAIGGLDQGVIGFKVPSEKETKEIYGGNSKKFKAGFRKLRADWPDTVLVFKSADDKTSTVYGPDLNIVSDLVEVERLTSEDLGMEYGEIPTESLDDAVDMLQSEGYAVAFIRPDAKGNPQVDLVGTSEESSEEEE